jgi:hypothetical protein
VFLGDAVCKQESQVVLQEMMESSLLPMTITDKRTVLFLMVLWFEHTMGDVFV